MAKSIYQIRKRENKNEDDFPVITRALKVIEDDVTGDTLFMVATTEYEIFGDWDEAKAAFEANK